MRDPVKNKKQINKFKIIEQIHKIFHLLYEGITSKILSFLEIAFRRQ